MQNEKQKELHVYLSVNEQKIKFVEIYFSDLTEDAQKRLCEEFKTNPEDENWNMNFFPLVILTREEGEK